MNYLTKSARRDLSQTFGSLNHFLQVCFNFTLVILHVILYVGKVFPIFVKYVLYIIIFSFSTSLWQTRLKGEGEKHSVQNAMNLENIFWVKEIKN